MQRKVRGSESRRTTGFARPTQERTTDRRTNDRRERAVSGADIRAHVYGTHVDGTHVDDSLCSHRVPLCGSSSNLCRRQRMDITALVKARRSLRQCLCR